MLCALAEAALRRDALGNPTSSTDPYNNSDLRVYDANGNLTSHTDKRNFTTSYTYDEMNRRETEVAPLPAPDNTTTWTYDHNGNTKTVTDRLGAMTRYFYDGMNRLVRTRNAYNRLVEEIGYDSNNNRISLKDAWSNTTYYTFTRQDLLKTINYPDGGLLTYAYDAAGNKVSGDDEGVAKQYIYNSMNRVIQVDYAPTHPDTYSHYFYYDKSGRQSRFIDGVGRYTDYTYDPRGLMTRSDMYKPDPAAVHSINIQEYDDQGNCTYTTDPMNNTSTHEYDMLNRNWRNITATGATTSKNFDANGNMISSTDGMNNTTTYIYNSMGWCTSVIDPQSNSRVTTYDAVGLVATESVSPDGGTTWYTTTYTRNSLGLPTTITDALGYNHWNYYDTAGRLTHYIDRNGTSVSYIYDSMGRTIQVNHPMPLNPNAAAQTTIHYDTEGRITSYSTPDIESLFAYDAFNRKISDSLRFTSWPPNTPKAVISFEYDKAGRVTKSTSFNLKPTVHTYNDVLLTKVADYEQAGAIISYTMNANGKVTQKALTNGKTENFAYDADGKLVYQEAIDPNNNIYGIKTYAYDSNSRMISDFTLGLYGNYSTVYNFDSRGLLIYEERTGVPQSQYVKSYNYDGMNCRTQKVENGFTTVYSYNELGRITLESGASNISYTYDNNGNLLAKSNGDRFQYDYRNELVCSNTSGGVKYYAYDLFKKRVEEVIPAEMQQNALMQDTLSRTKLLSTPIVAFPYDTIADVVGEHLYYLLWQSFGTLFERMRYDSSEPILLPYYTHSYMNVPAVGFAELEDPLAGAQAYIFYSLDATASNTLMTDAVGNVFQHNEYDCNGVTTLSTGINIRGFRYHQNNMQANIVFDERSGNWADLFAQRSVNTMPFAPENGYDPLGFIMLGAKTDIIVKTEQPWGWITFPFTITTKVTIDTKYVREFASLPNGSPGSRESWDNWMSNNKSKLIDQRQSGGTDCVTRTSVMLVNYWRLRENQKALSYKYFTENFGTISPNNDPKDGALHFEDMRRWMEKVIYYTEKKETQKRLQYIVDNNQPQILTQSTKDLGYGAFKENGDYADSNFGRISAKLSNGPFQLALPTSASTSHSYLCVGTYDKYRRSPGETWVYVDDELWEYIPPGDWKRISSGAYVIDPGEHNTISEKELFTYDGAGKATSAPIIGSNFGTAWCGVSKK